MRAALSWQQLTHSLFGWEWIDFSHRLTLSQLLSGCYDAKVRAWICKISDMCRIKRWKERGKGTEVVSMVEPSSCGVCLGSTKEKEKQAVKEECKQPQSSICSWAFGELRFNRNNKITFPASSHGKSFQHGRGIPMCNSYIYLHQAVSAPHQLPGGFFMRVMAPGVGHKDPKWPGGRFLPVGKINVWWWYVRGTTIPEILGSQRFKTTLVWVENTQGWCWAHIRNHENQSQELTAAAVLRVCWFSDEDLGDVFFLKLPTGDWA